MIKETQKTLIVNRANRTISNVSVLSLGLTLNGFSIDEITLSQCFDLAQGGAVPVYIDHETESKPHTPEDTVALLSAFFIENGILKATLTFLKSFADSEVDKFERLMELAETAPETFGLSIYYQGNYVTVDLDTKEETPSTKADKPEEIFLRPTMLFSCDFVSVPAANAGLSKNKESQPILSISEPIKTILSMITLTDEQTKTLKDHIAFLSSLIPTDAPATETPAEDVKTDEVKALSAKIQILEAKVAGFPTLNLGAIQEDKLSVQEQYNALRKTGDFKAALSFYRAHKSEIK